MHANKSLEVFIFLIREGSVLCLSPLLRERLDVAGIHGDFRGLQGECLNEVEIGVSDQSSEDPEEGLFVLVVALGGDVEVLEISFAVEGDLAGLHLAVLLVDLVSHKHDGNVVADPGQVLVPLGHVFVGDACGDIEHEDGGLRADVVALTEAAELFLAGGVPEAQLDGSVIGVEDDGADLDSLGGDVLFLEFSGDVALDEGGLADSAVSDEDDLELSHWGLLNKGNITFLLAPCMC